MSPWSNWVPSIHLRPCLRCRYYAQVLSPSSRVIPTRNGTAWLWFSWSCTEMNLPGEPCCALVLRCASLHCAATPRMPCSSTAHSHHRSPDVSPATLQLLSIDPIPGAPARRQLGTSNHTSAAEPSRPPDPHPKLFLSGNGVIGLVLPMNC